MSLLEPPENQPFENVLEEEPPPPPPPVQRPTNQFTADTCANCRRPLRQGVAQIGEDGARWFHVNPRIDDPANPGFCLAELYVEPPIKWGFLNTKGKSDFRVDSGPSNVRKGWSGGGVR